MCCAAACTLPWRDLPIFLPKTQQLLERFRSMSREELQRRWKCNDQIAANVERLRDMDLRRNLMFCKKHMDLENAVKSAQRRLTGQEKLSRIILSSSPPSYGKSYGIRAASSD